MENEVVDLYAKQASIKKKEGWQTDPKLLAENNALDETIGVKLKQMMALKGKLPEAVMQVESAIAVAKEKARESSAQKELDRELRRDLASENIQARREIAGMIHGGSSNKPLSQSQAANIAHGIRTEIKGNPLIKDYQDVSGKYQIMKEALKSSETEKNMVAVDQALITMFNKMTDPQSVVRESEYARTGNDLAFINKIKGRANKILSGGAGLAQDDRKTLVNMAEKFNKIYQNRYDETIGGYEQLAKDSGLNPDLVVGVHKRKNVATSSTPKSRAEYFSALRAANPKASDSELNSYLDKQGVK